MSRKKLLWAVLFIMSITALYAAASDQILFRVRLQKGKSYGLRMTTDQVISQEIEEQRINIKQTISIGYFFEVQDVGSDGSLSARVIYEKYATAITVVTNVITSIPCSAKIKIFASSVSKTSS